MEGQCGRRTECWTFDQPIDPLGQDRGERGNPSWPHYSHGHIMVSGFLRCVWLIWRALLYRAFRDGRKELRVALEGYRKDPERTGIMSFRAG